MRRLIADRYELQETVGSGGMSSVHRAFDTLLERSVALKILHEQYGADDGYVKRFRREARAVAQLAHPNIVTVIDRGEEGGSQYIVFELVEGENLKELVERVGPLPVRRTLELGLEVGRALAFAHGHGLVHRDVKPQNVLLNGDGRAKVTDFGIARTLDAVGTTETGTVLGTSHYIAPEQARGERVDAQTDVYSFGVVLYELLAGEVPFAGDNFLSVALKHVNEPVPNVLERRPDTPLRLAGLIERCLAKEPAGRPASMESVVEELEACLAELDAKAGGEATMIVRKPVAPPPRESRQARPSRPARRHDRERGLPVVPTLAALILLGAVVGGLLLARDDEGGAVTASSTPVELKGVASFDPPPGDGDEHGERVADSTDGDATSYWTTETYRSFGKPGVGLVLDAGRPLELARIVVTTDTPGFTAEIRAGGSRTGPFERVAAAKPVAARTTWKLEAAEARYYVVWITGLEGRAHVNEVEAF